MASQWADVGSIGSHFESLSDPRHTRNRKHLLSDVVVIGICGILCGANGPTAIRRWAISKANWLAKYLALPHGIPSRDCIRRLLLALKPEAFQKCFQEWIASGVQANESGERRLIAIDGKSCRRSHDASNDLGALHIVSAWASEQGIALGQVAAEDKSNEITAIPLLLDQLDLTDALVTIDAMGCQKEIAQKIVAGQGDFVLAVKDNQPKLRRAIKNHFVERLAKDLEELQYRYSENEDEGHGRVDERAYYLTRVPKDFAVQAEWPWVKAIGYAVRFTQHADGSASQEVRYYIVSRYLSGKRFGEAVRGHWGIESMHWILDVNFREDDSRTRERTLGNNLSWLRRFAITRLKHHPMKESIRGKMQIAGWNADFLAEVLVGKEV
jgi:predicted transposase YbfD/YdcC